MVILQIGRVEKESQDSLIQFFGRDVCKIAKFDKHSAVELGRVATLRDRPNTDLFECLEVVSEELLDRMQVLRLSNQFVCFPPIKVMTQALVYHIVTVFAPLREHRVS